MTAQIIQFPKRQPRVEVAVDDFARHLALLRAEDLMRMNVHRADPEMIGVSSIANFTGEEG